MRIAKWAIGVALIGSVMVSVTRAQSYPGGQTPVEPAYGYAEIDSTGVTQASYGYAEAADETAAAPSAALASPSDSAVGGTCSTCTSGSCGSYYGSCDASCGSCMTGCPFPPGDPVNLFDQFIMGADTALDVGGWISVGGYGNEYNAASNGPLGFNDLGNGINVHQLWGYVGKEADTGGCGLDWGAHVDYVFGVDGPDTQAFRGSQWDVTWSSGDYGSAIPQAYLELAYDYLTLKAGYFYTSIGYEVVQAPDNFFFSHAYTQYYIEPFTHTGALATYDGFENVTFFGGWTAGWDTAFEQVGDSSMFLGGVSIKPNDAVTLTYATSVGKLDYSDTQPGDVYMHSIVMDLQLTERLNWVIQNDLHYRNGLRNNVAAGGVNQYLVYEINDCWSLGGRFEWLYDRDGAFVQPGLASGSYYETTLGVNWKPHSNVVVRPEVRYDWFSGTYLPGGLPFDNHTKDEQFSLGFDVILQF